MYMYLHVYAHSEDLIPLFQILMSVLIPVSITVAPMPTVLTLLAAMSVPV